MASFDSARRGLLGLRVSSPAMPASIPRRRDEGKGVLLVPAKPAGGRMARMLHPHFQFSLRTIFVIVATVALGLWLLRPSDSVIMLTVKLWLFVFVPFTAAVGADWRRIARLRRERDSKEASK